MARCELVKPLTKIINQMLDTGIFPEQLKISKVFPLYKTNDKMSQTNYRPLALLPSISKIIECVLLEIITGISQGSVLCHFLFSVYINDLPLCTDMFNIISSCMLMVLRSSVTSAIFQMLSIL